MSRKKRPNKKPAKLVQPAQSTPEAPVVRVGDVLIQLVRESDSLLQELFARRSFDADVGEYLKLKNLVDDFNAWRTARLAPPTAQS
jgi:hypothetical protein